MVKTPQTSKTKTSVSDKALANYLDSMLHTATESDEAQWPDPEIDSDARPTLETAAQTTDKAMPANTESKSSVNKAKSTIARLALTDLDSDSFRDEAAPVFEPAPAPVHVTEPSTQVCIDDAESVASDHEHDLSRWLENGRPGWAQQRFDCLVFVVDGLKLAVPLILLGNIHTLDRDLTPLFDQPAWFLGLLPVQNGRNLRVVDTARLVMPERYRAESVDELAFGVGVYGSDWAFGCHQIEGSISIQPESVKWRSSRTSRPWLAGTIIDRMCALVDLNEFARSVFESG
jgi:purine-binding chemotaxis protein CheW